MMVKMRNKISAWKIGAALIFLVISLLVISVVAAAPWGGERTSASETPAGQGKEGCQASDWCAKASGFADSLWGGQEPQPQKKDWMQAEDWEIAACKMFGGFAEAQINGGSFSGDGKNSALSQLTLTLQAQKTPLPNGEARYEIAWYVEPFKDDVTFSINWNKNGAFSPVEGLESLKAGAGNANSDLTSFTVPVSERDAQGNIIGGPSVVTQVQMVLSTGGILTVPVIGGNEGGNPSAPCNSQFGEICTKCVSYAQKIPSSDSAGKECCVGGGCEEEPW